MVPESCPATVRTGAHHHLLRAVALPHLPDEAAALGAAGRSHGVSCGRDSSTATTSAPTRRSRSPSGVATPRGQRHRRRTAQPNRHDRALERDAREQQPREAPCPTRCRSRLDNADPVRTRHVQLVGREERCRQGEPSASMPRCGSRREHRRASVRPTPCVVPRSNWSRHHSRASGWQWLRQIDAHEGARRCAAGRRRHPRGSGRGRSSWPP